MKKLFLIFISIVFILFFLSGCMSSKQNAVNVSIVNENTKYSIKNISVTITDNENVKGYPNSLELTQKFREKFKKDLEDRNLLAKENEESVAVSLDITYKRVFSFVVSKAAVRILIDYKFKLEKDGQVILDDKEYNMTPSYGVFGNLATIAKQITCTSSAKDEERDFNKVANNFAEEILNLYKKK